LDAEACLNINTSGGENRIAMVTNIRVSRDFTKAPANDVANLVDDVVDGFDGNAAFPDPPVTGPELTILNTTLRLAITASDAGGPMDTALKKTAVLAAVAALRKDANYVENESNNDVATLLSSGFDIVNTNRAQSQLDQPVINSVTNAGSGQLLVRMNSIVNARSYQFQIATSATGPWTEAGIYTQARRNVLTGFTPGTIFLCARGRSAAARVIASGVRPCLAWRREKWSRVEKSRVEGWNKTTPTPALDLRLPAFDQNQVCRGKRPAAGNVQLPLTFLPSVDFYLKRKGTKL
jgi:hypothetical protein